MQLPKEFLNSLSGTEGFDQKAFIDIHDQGSRITSIRVNSFKPSETDFKLGAQVPWCDKGFYLDERPSFTFDPLFHAGCYYVQEAGSMFIYHALQNAVDLKDDLTVLDLCAAPGGKSTLILDSITENSILVSNEVIKLRAEILSQNISKWGSCNVAVTNNDPEAFKKLSSAFDVIVADVPCSGSGLFRKQTEAIDEWSLDSVNLCSTRQKRIMADALPSLKPNGILIYSTCSYSREENEDIVQWMISEMEMELVSIPLQKEWGLIDTGSGYRFYPYLTKSEGFFCAVLKKNENDEQHFHKKKLNEPGITKKESELLSRYINKLENTEVLKFKETFKLVSTNLLRFRSDLGQSLYFKKFGTTLGELKRDDFIPDHELALSIYLNNEVKKLDLSRSEAITFLQKENLQLKTEKGLHLMSYKNHGLGWAKILDNRINNYLPKDIRILSREVID